LSLVLSFKNSCRWCGGFGMLVHNSGFEVR
jgi:hypothetical protein